MIGNSVVSILFLINPSCSSSFNLVDSIFGVILGKAFFRSLCRFILSPLYSSKSIRRVHFLPIKSVVLNIVHFSCIVSL